MDDEDMELLGTLSLPMVDIPRPNHVPDFISKLYR
jgi:hypothetical protein